MWHQDKYLRKISDVIGSAELISFDIFDTVLFRTVSTPDRIFYYTGEKMAELCPKYDMPAEVFAGMREEAERLARKKAWETAQHEDVTLDEIYAEFNLGEKFSTRASECELETESQHIYLNRYMADFIHYCKEQGKKLAMVSDTYFSKSQIISFLEGCGFDASLIDFFVVSCEHRVLKHNGKLFRKLLEIVPKLSPNQMLHIGDNRTADINGALTVGIKAEHYGVISYDMLHPMSIEEKAYGTAESIMSLRKQALSLIPEEFDCRNDLTLFETGASVFGPLYSVFAEWIVEQCLKDSIGVVLAFMREGELLTQLISRAIHNRGLDIMVKPVFISRRTTEIISFDVIDGIVIDEYINRGGLLLSSLFSIFYLDIKNTPFSADATHTVEQCKQSGKFNMLEVYLKKPDTLAQINNRVTEQKLLLAEYIQSLTGGRSAITVDIGFRGTMQACLTNIHANGKAKLLHLLLMGLPYTNLFLLKGVPIRGWLGYGNEFKQQTEQVYRCIQVLEAITNADIGTTLAYENSEGVISPVLENVHIDEGNKRRKKIIWQGIQCYQNSWFEIINEKPHLVKKAITDRTGFLGILSRLLLMPTHEEAVTLGSMHYDESMFINEETTIIRAEDFIAYNIYDSTQMFINACVAKQTQHHVYWPEGVVSASNKHYYHEKNIALLTNPMYKRAVEFIIASDLKNKRIAIYGAGAVGREVVNVFCNLGVKIECIVDISQDLQGCYFSGIKVISPEESVGKVEAYIITPLRFEEEIKSLLNRLFNNLSLLPDIKTYC